MNDDQLLRYSRHILLDEIGIEGQQKLLASNILIVGAGGLGSPVALYLASSGAGSITVVDHDRIDTTNLQRQIAHKLAGVGRFKTHSVAEAIHAINPDVKVTSVTAFADAFLLDELVSNADVIVDCTDNFATRHAINRASVRHKKPLVSGAAIRFDAQISVYDPRVPLSPCYACVFPETSSFIEASCASMGVFAPLVGIIGSMQAAEVLKIVCDTGKPLTGRLLMLDARTMEWSEMKIPPNSACEVCGQGMSLPTAQSEATPQSKMAAVIR